ncbi:MAG: 50S ribosomal protein L24 [Actinomycetia bacterium]|nr:50S ribosomal protein L24 [Actinomycetes bacterium]
MAGFRIRKGDSVKVIAGDDKGVVGDVLAIYPETGKVKVSGVNLIRRNVKDRYDPRTGRTIKGGLISSEAPIDASNVQPVVRNDKGDRVVTRVGSERAEATKTRPDGSTYAGTRGTRVARKTGKEIR